MTEILFTGMLNPHATTTTVKIFISNTLLTIIVRALDKREYLMIFFLFTSHQNHAGLCSADGRAPDS